MVYLIRAELGDNISYKIGRTSKTAKQRLVQLQTSTTAKLNVVAEYESKYYEQLESVLHRHFSSYRISGEWFIFDDIEMSKDYFLDICEKHNTNIKVLAEQNDWYKTNILK